MINTYQLCENAMNDRLENESKQVNTKRIKLNILSTLEDEKAAFTTVPSGGYDLLISNKSFNIYATEFVIWNHHKCLS